uniref:Uncharacterized protein n=1 Tax=Arundo donax TaxID=35708 RepID=A0A0A9GLX7_ARUDO
MYKSIMESQSWASTCLELYIFNYHCKTIFGLLLM